MQWAPEGVLLGGPSSAGTRRTHPESPSTGLIEHPGAAAAALPSAHPTDPCQAGIRSGRIRPNRHMAPHVGHLSHETNPIHRHISSHITHVRHPQASHERTRTPEGAPAQQCAGATWLGTDSSEVERLLFGGAFRCPGCAGASASFGLLEDACPGPDVHVGASGGLGGCDRAMASPEQERRTDVWDLAVFGLSGRVRFAPISQGWLRETATAWAEEELPRHRGR